MKVPGGWKSFFKNVAIASVIVYVMKYLMNASPSIPGVLAMAVVICLAIAFVESRLVNDTEVDDEDTVPPVS